VIGRWPSAPVRATTEDGDYHKAITSCYGEPGERDKAALSSFFLEAVALDESGPSSAWRRRQREMGADY
jgi:hypothetical protein